jgi:hypothetical protein
MFRLIARSLGVAALGLFLGMATGTEANAADSGFLKDYSQLQVAKDPLGVERRVWADPGFKRDNYKGVLIDRVIFYPEAQATSQFPMQTLNEIRDYLDQTLRKSVATVMPLVDKPGPGVLRMRAAITASSVDKSLKPYQMIPVALVFTAAKRGSGAAEYPVTLAVEFEATDSVSGKPLARVVREAKGVEVQGDQTVTLSMARKQIDDWGAAMQQAFAERFGQKLTK